MRGIRPNGGRESPVHGSESFIAVTSCEERGVGRHGGARGRASGWRCIDADGTRSAAEEEGAGGDRAGTHVCLRRLRIACSMRRGCLHRARALSARPTGRGRGARQSERHPRKVYK